MTIARFILYGITNTDKVEIFRVLVNVHDKVGCYQEDIACIQIACKCLNQICTTL